MTAWQMLGVGLTSFVVALVVVLTRRWHGHWTGDFEDSGVQKHHRGSPPRVGIVPLMAGVGLGLYFLATSIATQNAAATHLLGWLMVASLPVVLLGLADDVTKKISPKVRFLGAAVAGLVAILLLDIRIQRADVVLLDSLLLLWPASVLVTLLMVCGFTNAMNIVDGLNGLAGGLTVLMLAATGIVAARFGDQMIVELCLVLGVAVVGFLLVNFPRGLMFLGDGGAYFIGFMLVQIWILLVTRNPGVTPWFVVAVAFHPTMETIFSIYRRRFHPNRRGAAMTADRLHLHSLVYRRRARQAFSEAWAERWVANAAGAVAVALFGAAPMALALIAPGSIVFNVAVVMAAFTAFLVWFGRLVHFQGSRHVARVGASSVVRVN